MNRKLLPTVSLLALLAACSAASSSSSNIDEASSNLTRDTSPNVASADMAALVAGNSAFATDAYKALSAAAGGNNLVYSPYSISSALAMTYAGAGGTTATEMAAAMHYTLPEAKLHPAFDALDLQLAARANAPSTAGQTPLTLHIANALFGEKADTFGKPFLDTLMTSYGAGVKLVDFEGSPDDCRNLINGWISDETNAKITNMLAPGTIDASTRLALVDAIYFDGDWADPFEANLTADGTFTKLDGSTVTAKFMGGSSGPFVHTDAYDAVELAYAGNQVAMDIVIPKAGTFASFESTLTAGSLAGIVDSMQPGDLELTLPKFTIAGSTTDLSAMLQGFGMKTAFTSAADFSAIDLSEPVQIAQVLHKAYVSVDEKGTEAAAATVVTLDAGAVASQTPTVIRANRPFFFAMRDIPTGTILFAGRVTDPTAN